MPFEHVRIGDAPYTALQKKYCNISVASQILIILANNCIKITQCLALRYLNASNFAKPRKWRQIFCSISSFMEWRS